MWVGSTIDPTRFDAPEITLLDWTIAILPLSEEGSPCAQRPGIN